MSDFGALEARPLLPCLSLWQPWAYVMLHGPKDLENRPWPWTRAAGPLLVHAAKTRRDCTQATLDRLYDLWPEMPCDLVGRCAFGAIVGVVNVTGCSRAIDMMHNPWAWGPFCHVWADRTPFARPVPYTGRQGVFMVPASAVLEQLRALRGRAVA